MGVNLDEDEFAVDAFLEEKPAPEILTLFTAGAAGKTEQYEIESYTGRQRGLAAAKEVLDRAGVKGGVEIDVKVEQAESPSEKLLKKLASMRKDEPLEDLGEKTDEEVVEEPTEEPSEPTD